jgi:DNA polymerase-3 subunit alpha
MKSEDELNEKWLKDYKDIIPLELFEQAKANTVKIANMCKGIQLDRSLKLPMLPNANELLMDAIMEGVKIKGIPKTPEYQKRIAEEYELICRKDFASYFLIKKIIVDEARREWAKRLGFGNGSTAVGPGRGSAVSSLVNYALGITDIDPIKHGLLFSRFLSENRGGRMMKIRFSNV